MKAYSKRFGIFLITALLLAGVMTAPVQAEEKGGPYKYTIRLYAGKQGSFPGGKTMLTYEEVGYGDTVIFHPNDVILNNDSKYYVKGVRESGRDNNTVSAPSFQVTGDRDYVVAYGLRGNMVAYVINYLDLDGNPLAPAETYYGNVGDKPVIAFLYIEGYQPQAYNLTKTLSENEAENVFTFVYSPIDGVITDVTTTYEELPGTTDSVVQVIEGEPRVRTRTVETAPAEEETDEEAGQNTPTSEQTTILPTQEPLDTLDLDGIEFDDTAVPLGNMKFKLGPIEMDARLLLLLLVIIADIAVVVAASIWYWKPYRKKKANEKQEASQPV